jgi:hypothetical protein
MENDSIDISKESVSQLKNRLKKLIEQELSDASKTNNSKPKSKDPNNLVDDIIKDSSKVDMSKIIEKENQLFGKEYIEREYKVDDNMVDLFLERVSRVNLSQDIIKQIMDSPIENISTEIELSVKNKISDTRNEKDMQELEKAKQLVSDAREILYKLLDKKLSEHTIYYYHKKKGIGFRALNDFEQNRDKVHITTLINNLQKMI